MKQLETLTKEDFRFLSTLHEGFCTSEGKESQTKYHNFIIEVASFKNKGYDTEVFDHYVEMYRELKECCGTCKTEKANLGGRE